MALLAGGDNSVQVVITTKGDTKGIRDTSDALSALSGKTEESHSTFLRLSGAVAAGQAAFAAFKKMSGVVTGAVGDAASFEQTRIGLENMLGSADKARGLLGDISKFAANTPFEFPELAQATRQLVAFGFTGEDAFKTMQQLGDVSAAVGAPINDLSYLMGTLRTQGRAFTIDIRQFAQRGIPIYEYLAKVLGTNEQAIAKMIEEGKIGFPEVQKAFRAMTGEGGKFHNTMSKQSKSLSGLFSTLKDNIGFTVREMLGITQSGDIKDGSLFSLIKDGAESLTNVLPKLSKSFMDIMGDVGRLASKVGEYLQPKFEALWNTINTKLVPMFKNLWHEIIEPLAPVIGTLLVGAIGLAIDAINLLITTLTPVANFLLEHKEILIGVATALGAWYAAMKISDGFNALSNFVTLGTEGIKGMMAQTDGAKGALTLLNNSMSSFAGFGILAGAATVAGIAIVNAANDAKKAWDDAMRSVDKASQSDDEVIRRLKNLQQNGTPEQKQRAKDTLNRLAATGAFASGGYTGRGAADEIAGVVHKGEYVIPKSGVDQSTGLPKSAGSQTTVNYNAPIYLQTAEATREFFKIQDRNSLLASKGLSIARV